MFYIGGYASLAMAKRKITKKPFIKGGIRCPKCDVLMGFNYIKDEFYCYDCGHTHPMGGNFTLDKYGNPQ